MGFVYIRGSATSLCCLHTLIRALCSECSDLTVIGALHSECSDPGFVGMSASPATLGDSLDRDFFLPRCDVVLYCIVRHEDPASESPNMQCVFVLFPDVNETMPTPDYDDDILIDDGTAGMCICYLTHDNDVSYFSVCTHEYTKYWAWSGSIPVLQASKNLHGDKSLLLMLELEHSSYHDGMVEMYYISHCGSY